MNCSHTTKFPVPVFLQIPTILEKGELKNLNQIMLSIETFTLMNIWLNSKGEKERCVLREGSWEKFPSPCSYTCFFAWPITVLPLFCSPPVWRCLQPGADKDMRWWGGGEFLQASQSPLDISHGSVFTEQPQSSEDKWELFWLLPGASPQPCLPTSSSSPHRPTGWPPTSRSSPWSPKCPPQENGRRLWIVHKVKTPRILGGSSPLSRSQERYPQIKHIWGKKIIFPDPFQCI